MSPVGRELRARVERWIEDDPDEACRRELSQLLAQGDEQELRERFQGPLAFGTAGLRAAVGAGESRMNRAVVAKATRGLCDYLRATLAGARERGLCIAFDARPDSAAFADEAAGVAAGAGFVVHRFEAVAPTPLLAFAVPEVKAAAGVMITASHNPPVDNGYKVYLQDGAQVAPPADAEIARAIARVPSARGLERADAPARVLDRDLEARYLGGLPRGAAPAPLRIVYTPLHGVGARLVVRALAGAGFDDVHLVPEQAEPDGLFPTVAVPNPEDPACFELALSLARDVDAELVLANDPDADRLAVAARGTDGRWVQLAGNQVGVLLAHYLLSTEGGGERRLLLSTLVSTPLIGDIARAHGARWETTLTGFKWIFRRAQQLQAEGARLVLGFEEALGFAVGERVHDKDGISAAVACARMAAWCKARGGSLLDELDEVACRYGLGLSEQRVLAAPGRAGAERIAHAMQRIREDAPETLARHRIVDARDLAAPRPDEHAGWPAANLVIWELEGRTRVAIRPSGTEPKLKVYLDVVRPPVKRGELSEARQQAGDRLRNIGRALDEYLAL